jgi:transcriptional regulator with XRE-family HTH domain
MLKQIGSSGGSLVRQLRTEQGLSQVALAQRVGMPQSHLQKIEAGRTDLRVSSLVALLQALGYDLAAGDPNTIRIAQAWERSRDRRPRFE